MPQARSAAASSQDTTPSRFGAEATRGLSAADLGARVSVLFRIEGDPEHPFSEAVGVLGRIEGDHSSGSGILEVVRRDGETVRVYQEKVVALKLLDGRTVREA